VGFRGETVTVSDGYARNFLIPRNAALRATPSAMKVADELNRVAEKKETHVREEAEGKQAKLKDISLSFEVNAGEGGKLFGSVTSADIAERMNALDTGVEIDRKDVRLKEPIKALGRYTVDVRLFRQIAATIEVWVVSNQPETPKTPAAVAEPAADEAAEAGADEGETQEAETADVDES